MPSGDQCGHVESVAHWASAAVNRTFAAHPSAVSIKWRYSNQRRNLTPIELSQFGQLCQEQCGCARTNSTDRGELPRFGREFLRLFNVLLDELIKPLDLLFNLVD